MNYLKNIVDGVEENKGILLRLKGCLYAWRRDGAFVETGH